MPMHAFGRVSRLRAVDASRSPGHEGGGGVDWIKEALHGGGEGRRRRRPTGLLLSKQSTDI